MRSPYFEQSGPPWLRTPGPNRGEVSDSEGDVVLEWRLDTGELLLAEETLDLDETAATLQLTRFREEDSGARSTIGRLLGWTEPEFLHVELRSGRRRESWTAELPSEDLEGLPWKRSEGKEVDAKSLRNFVSAFAHRAPEGCAIASWSEAETVAPTAREGIALVAVKPGKSVEDIAPRPPFSAMDVFKEDWSMTSFVALILPLVFGVLFLVLAISSLVGGYMGGFAFFGPLGLILSGIAAYFWKKDVTRTLEAARLFEEGHQVEGVVLRLAVTSNEDHFEETRSTPLGRIQYSYEVDGVRHEGETLAYPPEQLRYKAGASIIVHYDPKDPSVHAWPRPIRDR